MIRTFSTEVAVEKDAPVRSTPWEYVDSFFAKQKVSDYGKGFLYHFPMVLNILHSLLHMTQAKSYQLYGLVIPDPVLFTETAVHFLSYWYVHRVFNGDPVIMSMLLLGNVFSWLTGLPLIGNYTPGNVHEVLSYFLTSVMGAVSAYHLTKDEESINKVLQQPLSFSRTAQLMWEGFWGIFYFCFSYAYLAYGVFWVGDWGRFLTENHFMELVVTTFFTAMTMGYASAQSAKEKQE